jgi:uridine kinase
MPTNRPLIIGVAGGSGSGKTTVIHHLRQRFGDDLLCLLEHDSYYRDLAHLDFAARAAHNFDHPSSLETELLIRHVNALMEGYSVDVPVYDFKNHVRKPEVRKMFPREIILIDGILIFSEKELRDIMDIKIFVDTDDDIRLLRRLRRDIMERGRAIENVLTQYETFVRPMHLEFVEPSKRYADIIIPHGGENKVALDFLIAMIQSRLSTSVSDSAD